MPTRYTPCPPEPAAGVAAGIYSISYGSDRTYREYVGQSNHINKRIEQHWDDLFYGRHINKRMQRDWNACDGDGFKARVLAIVPEEYRGFKRQVWLLL